MGQFYDPKESIVVYYDPNSGDTHMLTEFAAFVVQQFAGEPLATNTLVKMLAPHMESENDGELQNTVLAVLNELHSLDILQQI